MNKLASSASSLSDTKADEGRFALLSNIAGSRAGQVALSISISGLLLWLSLRQVQLSELMASLAAAKGLWLLAALGFYWLELLARTFRWSVILQSVRPIAFHHVTVALIIGYAANNVLPARLGELFRADFLGRRYGVSRISAMATILVERTFDLMSIILCGVFGMLLFLEPASSLGGTIYPAVVTAVALLLLVVGFMYGFLLVKPEGLAIRWSPRLASSLQSFADGLRLLHRPLTLATAAASSVVVWVFNGLALWAIFGAIGVSLEYQHILMLIAVSGVAAMIPSAPAALGTLQFAYVIALGFFGYSAIVGFSAASLVQLCLLGSETIVGIALYFGLSLFAPKKIGVASRK
jgi:uncharacterized protein (TIRG00374 family)